MKTLRHILLPVLLSAFGFFVAHDYVIADVDADTQYELCYSKQSGSALDLPSQIHAYIHTLLSLPQTQTLMPRENRISTGLCAAPEMPQSHISSLWPRPPLKRFFAL